VPGADPPAFVLVLARLFVCVFDGVGGDSGIAVLLALVGVVLALMLACSLFKSLVCVLELACRSFDSLVLVSTGSSVVLPDGTGTGAGVRRTCRHYAGAGVRVPAAQPARVLLVLARSFVRPFVVVLDGIDAGVRVSARHIDWCGWWDFRCRSSVRDRP